MVFRCLILSNTNNMFNFLQCKTKKTANSYVLEPEPSNHLLEVLLEILLMNDSLIMKIVSSSFSFNQLIIAGLWLANDYLIIFSEVSCKRLFCTDQRGNKGKALLVFFQLINYFQLSASMTQRVILCSTCQKWDHINISTATEIKVSN